MKRIFSLFAFIIAFNMQAQETDAKAKAILDDLSKTTKAYKTIAADVVFTVLGKDKKPVDKAQNWKIQVKGQKFKLDIPGTSIVCDGKVLWNYNKDAKEVTIKNFDGENDDQNPAKIFTMYETGYKYKFDKEEKAGLILCNVIELYPSVKPEKKKFHTVRLYIDKVKKQIVCMKMMMKDGGTQIYDVKTIKANTEMADALFVFDTKGLKADQINDERD